MRTILNNKNSGFTIIEMLVVVTIIGVLSMTAVPVAEIAFIKLKEDQLRNELYTLRGAIQKWRKDSQEKVFRLVSNAGIAKNPRYTMRTLPDCKLYPPNLYDLVSPKGTGYDIAWTDPDGVNRSFTIYMSPYLHKIPNDPFIGNTVWTLHYAKSNTPVTYRSPTDPVPAPNPATDGIFDISIHPDVSERKGFVTSISGSKYEDW
jgi:general secretion pathway protein G